MLNNSSIFQSTTVGMGSVGGFFTFPNAATIYGISNNHVIAGLNSGKVDDPIFDRQNRQIGQLKFWLTLNGGGVTNFLDAALFEYTGPTPPVWRILGNAAPKPFDFIEPRLDGHVYMMREDNTARLGRITDPQTSAVINFQLSGQHFSFSNLIEIVALDGRPFSNPGDSGNIILSSTHNIVGLLLGAATGGAKSYAMPFVDGILDFLPLVI